MQERVRRLAEKAQPDKTRDRWRDELAATRKEGGLTSAPTKLQSLGPGEAVFGERQGTNAFSGDAKDRVAHGGEDWRGGGVSQGSRGIGGLKGKGFGFRRRPGASDRGVFVGNGLDGTARGAG